MSWISWLFLLAGVYLIVLAVRAIINFVSWFREEYLDDYTPEPRDRRRLEEKSERQAQQMRGGPSSSAAGRAKEKDHAGEEPPRKRIPNPVLAPRRARRLPALAELARWLAAKKTFDYWVNLALADEDPQKRVEHCSKALKLNPTYAPAWGLKAGALWNLKRYEEADRCYDKILEMDPNALAWHRKGLCCRHLAKHKEAIECFDKALAASAAEDRELYQEALRSKTLAEEELARRQAP